jgi:hypothetical protein
MLSLLLGQRATHELKVLLSSDDSMALWWGTRVEAVSAIWRLRRAGEVAGPSASRLVTQLDAVISAAYEIQPTEEVRATACRILRVHELRAADALQFAAALVWAGYHPAGLGFVCLDRKLREAAEREGFAVLPA